VAVNDTASGTVVESSRKSMSVNLVDNNSALVGASVVMLRWMKCDLRETSLGAVFTAGKRACVVHEALAGGRHHLGVLVTNQLLVTRLHCVYERVGHVELGQTINCAQHAEFPGIRSTLAKSRIAVLSQCSIKTNIKHVTLELLLCVLCLLCILGLGFVMPLINED